MVEQYAAAIEKLKEAGRYRFFSPLTERDGARITLDGRRLLNLTSNDYLGLAGDRVLHEEFYAEISVPGMLDRYGLGSGSSRLLTGDNIVSHMLEAAISKAYGSEECLLFNSGYHANIGILPVLAEKGDLVLSDKLNHASLIDGMRLSRAEFKRFRHADYRHLRTLLTQYRRKYRRTFLVTESVFSMDGDVADLKELVEIKKEFDCLLYVDEAHGTGLYGENGLGMAEEQGTLQDIDILVGTFGKAVASVGAYVVCSRLIKEFLVNNSRSLIFTTGLPPVVISWNLFIFSKLAGMGGRRRHLKNISHKMRQRLKECGIETAGTTNIVPVMIGEDGEAVRMAAKMREAGYLVFPVRPPTVPEHTARFRISLTAAMTDEDLEKFLPTLQMVLEGRL